MFSTFFFFIEKKKDSKKEELYLTPGCFELCGARPKTLSLDFANFLKKVGSKTFIKQRFC